jgi:single-stranded DNA-binding protein
MNEVQIEVVAVGAPYGRKLEKGPPSAVFVAAFTDYFPTKTGEVREVQNVVEIETWGETAVRCMAAVRQGTAVRITGRLRSYDWPGANGTRNYKLRLLVDALEIVGATNASQRTDTTPAVGQPAGVMAPAVPASSAPPIVSVVLPAASPTPPPSPASTNTPRLPPVPTRSAAVPVPPPPRPPPSIPAPGTLPAPSGPAGLPARSPMPALPRLPGQSVPPPSPASTNVQPPPVRTMPVLPALPGYDPNAVTPAPVTPQAPRGFRKLITPRRAHDQWLAEQAAQRQRRSA